MFLRDVYIQLESFAMIGSISQVQFSWRIPFASLSWSYDKKVIVLLIGSQIKIH